MALVSIALPTAPGIRRATPKPIELGAWQEPVMGGTATYLGRLGDHWSVAFETPRLKPEPDGRLWSSALCESIGKTVRIAIPQPGLDIGNPGFPSIDGAGQSGLTLNLKGLTPGYVVRRGQWITLTDGNFLYAHRQQLGDAVVTSAGKVAVTLWPMLRPSFASDMTVNIAAPEIEGRLIGAVDGWTMELARVAGLAFTVEEVR